MQKLEHIAKRLYSSVEKVDSYYELHLDNEFPLSLDRLVVKFVYANDMEDMRFEIKEAGILRGKIVFLIATEEMMPTLYEKLTSDKTNLYVGLESQELSHLLLSPKPQEVLAKLISSQIALTQISPYQIGGGVHRESIFFGRDKIISHIINKGLSNYIIIGGRQVGKSSLLKAIERSYNEIGEVECHYISASNANLIEDIKLQLNQEEKSNKALAQVINSGEKRYLFLIDEADDFVKYEKKHDYANLKFMRSLSEKIMLPLSWQDFGRYINIPILIINHH
ncbi:MAG: AAA family ATPase [Sulfurovum sp.]|nr:AAA family ATPase [Sulfurovum sp.]